MYSNPQECLYCQNNETLHNLMIEIAHLSVSRVFLFKEQTYRGRCLVAYDKHVNDLNELSDDERNAFMADVRALADKEKVEFDEAEYNRSLPLIRTQLKALIARDLWDMSEYFQVMNTTDRTVRQALKVLNEGAYERLMTRPVLRPLPAE